MRRLHIHRFRAQYTFFLGHTGNPNGNVARVYQRTFRCRCGRERIESWKEWD